MTADQRPDHDTAPEGGQHIVLVVDDADLDRHLAGSIVQKLPGWKALFAANGVEALAVLEKQSPDIVLTDLIMPALDGLELVKTIHTRFPLIPVILMTAHGSEDIAIKALQAGAASYCPKKTLAHDLAEILEQVLAASQTDRSQTRILECLTRHETQFVIENDISLVPPLVGYLEECLTKVNLCEPSGLVLLGVALHEALTNAIYHGNLELSSDIKEQDESRYYALAQLRRHQEPYARRRVYVTASFTREEATFVIRDQGKGFDPSTLPDPTDPSNLEKSSGRGLLLIQTFMDRVEHNGAGNQITMTKFRASMGDQGQSR